MSVSSARRQLQWILDDNRHFVTLGGFGWTIMHPLSCRMTPDSLLGCRFNDAMAEDTEAPDPGRYEVSLRGGRIHWGEEMGDDFDPIVARLRIALEQLEGIE